MNTFHCRSINDFYKNPEYSIFFVIFAQFLRIFSIELYSLQYIYSLFIGFYSNEFLLLVKHKKGKGFYKDFRKDTQCAIKNFLMAVLVRFVLFWIPLFLRLIQETNLVKIKRRFLELRLEFNFIQKRFWSLLLELFYYYYKIIIPAGDMG